MSFKSCLLFAMPCLWFGASICQAQDAEGCQDHPLLSRLPNYRISRCQTRDFDSRNFLVKQGTGTKEIAVEGRVTELRYSLKDGATEASRVQVQRNYENAVTRIGGMVTGRNDDGHVFLKVAKNGQEIWVDVDAYITSEYGIFIVEKGAMKQDVVADAAALACGIQAEGKVAVYGITFDTGKAEVKPESAATLAEIAKMLNADAALKLHVVGHTDNVAGFDLNMKLSQARAEAVVQALVTKHSIAAARLKPYGVGPLAPVATNANEEGRAKNRRVELVMQ